ncbi:uncharacterized protein TNCV_312751 [Trichonephila clavipes]|nr:uncharacterized protein TNCV_312751 [Trichonephila clavipes]
MGQPGKVQTTLLTPVDVVKAEWLSKSSNRNPDMLAAKPPKPKIIEIAKDLPEYIIDPGTKTTYLKGKFLGKTTVTEWFWIELAAGVVSGDRDVLRLFEALSPMQK